MEILFISEATLLLAKFSDQNAEFGGSEAFVMSTKKTHRFVKKVTERSQVHKSVQHVSPIRISRPEP